ncbi:hypothetical protein FRB98_004527, partial [Tulasnella sp. 332]
SLLAVAPLPGLSAVAIVMQEIYKLVQGVSARNSECKALAGYANSVIEIIEKYRNTVPKSQMALAVSSVE